MLIGSAYVSLQDETLLSVDKYVFEDVDEGVGIPLPFVPLFRLAARVSPMLRDCDSGTGTVHLEDRYFCSMGGNEFNTILTGPVSDLNRFGWDF